MMFWNLSPNVSCSASVTQLADTSTLRIGSLLDFSEPGSQSVEVMSVTLGQPMEQSTSPGPSSHNNTIELGCGNVDQLLAADSEEETDETQDEDHLLSESEEEKESPEKPLSWAEDE